MAPCCRGLVGPVSGSSAPNELHGSGVPESRFPALGLGCKTIPHLNHVAPSINWEVPFVSGVHTGARVFWDIPTYSRRD